MNTHPQPSSHPVQPTPPVCRSSRVCQQPIRYADGFLPPNDHLRHNGGDVGAMTLLTITIIASLLFGYYHISIMI